MILAMIILPFACALAVLLPVSKRFRGILLCAVSCVYAAAAASCWMIPPAPQFNGYLALDPVGLIMLSAVGAVFVLVSVFMIGYFEHERRSNRTFTACLFTLLSLMTVVATSYHFGLLWVAVETTTLLSAPLISFHRNQESLDATWKYLLVCSVGISLALMGTFFMAIAAHETGSLLLPDIIAGASSLNAAWLKLGVIFLLVGYGCKMGLAPMHSWKPDVYGQSTGMAAVIMSGLLTQCAFLGIVRVAHVCNSAGLRTFYSSMLVVMGIVSLIVPAVFLLGVRNIKRAFAYSSVEHMGILVLGLALGGVGTIGAFFHVINNALSKTVMFLTAGSVAQKYGSSRVEELRGIVHAYPATGVFLIISALAGTGMFPFATFHSELMVLNAAISGKRFFLAAGFLACLAFIFIGMTRTVLQAVFGPPAEPVMPKRENSYMNAAIAAAAAVLLWFGVWMPAFLDRGIRAAASMIGG